MRCQRIATILCRLYTTECNQVKQKSLPIEVWFGSSPFTFFTVFQDVPVSFPSSSDPIISPSLLVPEPKKVRESLGFDGGSPFFVYFLQGFHSGQRSNCLHWIQFHMPRNLAWHARRNCCKCSTRCLPGFGLAPAILGPVLNPSPSIAVLESVQRNLHVCMILHDHVISASTYFHKRLDLWIPTLSKQMVLLDYKKRMDDDDAYDQPRPLTSGLCNCLNQIARIPKTLCHRSRPVPRCWRVPNVAPSAVGSHPWPPGSWKAPKNRSHFGSFWIIIPHTWIYIYIYVI